MTNNHPANNALKKSDFTSTTGLIIAIILGGFVRFSPVLAHTYPLNDGGFFLTMIRDLQMANYHLPEFSSYNLSDIPYAYPPLAFFFSGFLSDITRIAAIDLVRILPAIFSTLTIPAFFWLATKLLPARIQVIAATIGFALLPTAFDWTIVGGGLTRAPAYLFSIITLTQVYSLLTTQKKKPIILIILFASLTVLCHPGVTWFTLYSAGILFIFHYRKQPNNQSKSLLIAAGILVVTAPWWGMLISRHSLQTLLNPYQTESFSIAALITLFSLLFTNEPLVDIFAVLGLLGLLISLRNRKFFVPAWLLSVFIFEPRLSAVYVAIPVALLAGIGFDQAILPIVTPQNTSHTETTPHFVGKLPKCVTFFLLLYALISAFIAPNYNALSQAQVESMKWIKAQTPVHTSFVVLTGNSSYGNDYTNEWFPTLSERTSHTTPQGHEWLPGKEFNRRVQLHSELQTCAHQNLTCLEDWSQTYQEPFTHVYISTKALAENGISHKYLLNSLDKAANFELIYENADSLIYSQNP